MLVDLLDYAKHFAFAHDEELFPIDFHGAAGVLTEENLVACFQVHGHETAIFLLLTWTDREDFAPGRLFC